MQRKPVTKDMVDLSLTGFYKLFVLRRPAANKLQDSSPKILKHT